MRVRLQHGDMFVEAEGTEAEVYSVLRSTDLWRAFTDESWSPSAPIAVTHSGGLIFSSDADRQSRGGK